MNPIDALPPFEIESPLAFNREERARGAVRLGMCFLVGAAIALAILGHWAAAIGILP